MPDEELNKLREEWRTRLAEDISALKKSVEGIQSDVHSIRESFAKAERVDKIEERVSKLENFRSQLFGIMIGAQFIGGSLVGLITWIISHFSN